MKNELADLCRLLANDYSYDGDKWEVTKAEKTALGWRLKIKRRFDEDENTEGAENADN